LPILLVAGLVVLALIGGGVVFANRGGGTTRFERAVEECDLSGNEDGAEGLDDFDVDEYARLGDDGHALSLEGYGEDDTAVQSTTALVVTLCVLDELDAPDAITSRMNNTRALDGVQAGEWGGIQASWSYHPDNGLDVVLSED
jgi:hypothetical protein